eukprot:CAMPEP_0182507076 /NCGR_PEP_ID=MMETSP1321-20130603/22465_1 /TAXON_ID=91990 /ORGANISM="Bolidomonas sp., Strain RCC1657" /LENGTH=42 /DNA_ID= /DNA_START= /DNA_END= /DNA_ORIENTATION=
MTPIPPLLKYLTVGWGLIVVDLPLSDVTELMEEGRLQTDDVG